MDSDHPGERGGSDPLIGKDFIDSRYRQLRGVLRKHLEAVGAGNEHRLYSLGKEVPLHLVEHRGEVFRPSKIV